MKFCDERIQKHFLNGGKIKRSGADYSICLNDNNTVCCKHGYISVYDFKRKDFTTDDWKIVKPEYDWDKIIKDKVLCVFWNDGFEDCLNIDTLRGISKNGNFIDGNGCICDNCRLFNLADFNIAKDLKEYEK